jgi:hypothetical protein
LWQCVVTGQLLCSGHMGIHIHILYVNDGILVYIVVFQTVIFDCLTVMFDCHVLFCTVWLSAVIMFGCRTGSVKNLQGETNGISYPSTNLCIL